MNEIRKNKNISKDSRLYKVLLVCSHQMLTHLFHLPVWQRKETSLEIGYTAASVLHPSHHPLKSTAAYFTERYFWGPFFFFFFFLSNLGTPQEEEEIV